MPSIHLVRRARGCRGYPRTAARRERLSALQRIDERGATRRTRRAARNWSAATEAWSYWKTVPIGSLEWCVVSCRETWKNYNYAVGIGCAQPNVGGNGRKSTYRALEGSLKRLQTDYIDLYWMHVWDMVTPVGELLQTLTKLIKQGKICYFGFSTCRPGMRPRRERFRGTDSSPNGFLTGEYRKAPGGGLATGSGRLTNNSTALNVHLPQQVWDRLDAISRLRHTFPTTSLPLP